MKKELKQMIGLLAVLALLLAVSGCASETPAGTGSAENKIKNIILIIGDGMGLEHITAGQLVSGEDFAFTRWQYVNVNTDSVDASGKGGILTDSAAAATAMATGKLTVNRYIGKDASGKDLPTFLDVAAEEYGKATGIVTTDYLYGATPSAFSAHSLDRGNTKQIIRSQIQSGVTLLCGAIHYDCVSERGKIQEAGYGYCDKVSGIAGTMDASKAYWLLDLAGTAAGAELKDASAYALDYLSKDADGFVLVIEQAHIDKYAEKNDFDSMLHCVRSLNDTVDTVMAWVGERDDTTVIVTADHETGGLCVSTQPGYDSTCKAQTGDTVYYQWSTETHTRAKVGAFLYGWEADFSEYGHYGSAFLIKNCEVNRLVRDILEGS